MEYCEDSKYKWLVTIEEAFIKLEKYVVTSYHNTDLSIMLHLGSLPQTSGLINLLRLVRLLHGMMMCTTAVMMCLKLGVLEDELGLGLGLGWPGHITLSQQYCHDAVI